MSEQVVSVPAEYIGNVFGNYDENIKTLEKTLSVTVLNRGDDVKITGDEKAVKKAADVIKNLIRIAAKGESLGVQHVNYLSSLSEEEKKQDVGELLSDIVCFTKAGKPIRPKTFGQKRYVNSIREHMLTFGIGPAGTGKTYLAMAMASQAFKSGEVGRIILTRPAI